EGDVVYDALELLVPAAAAEGDHGNVDAALGALADDDNRNATLEAIGDAFAAPADWARTGGVPFSSARKWSAATFDGHGTWVIGAPENILGDANDPARRRADELAAEGRRVLLLVRSDG